MESHNPVVVSRPNIVVINPRRFESGNSAPKHCIFGEQVGVREWRHHPLKKQMLKKSKDKVISKHLAIKHQHSSESTRILALSHIFQILLQISLVLQPWDTS